MSLKDFFKTLGGLIDLLPDDRTRVGDSAKKRHNYETIFSSENGAWPAEVLPPFLISPAPDHIVKKVKIESRIGGNPDFDAMFLIGNINRQEAADYVAQLLSKCGTVVSDTVARAEFDGKKWGVSAFSESETVFKKTDTYIIHVSWYEIDCCPD